MIASKCAQQMRYWFRISSGFRNEQRIIRPSIGISTIRLGDQPSSFISRVIDLWSDLFIYPAFKADSSRCGWYIVPRNGAVLPTEWWGIYHGCARWSGDENRNKICPRGNGRAGKLRGTFQSDVVIHSSAESSAYRRKGCAWSVHPIEHVISAYYDITHGVGLAVLTLAWMSYVLSDKRNFLKGIC